MKKTKTKRLSSDPFKHIDGETDWGMVIGGLAMTLIFAFLGGVIIWVIFFAERAHFAG